VNFAFLNNSGKIVPRQNKGGSGDLFFIQAKIKDDNGTDNSILLGNFFIEFAINNFMFADNLPPSGK